MTSMHTRGPAHAPRKHVYDLEYTMLRHRIFEHLSWSADHITEIIWNSSDAAQRWEYIEERRLKGPKTLSGTSVLPRDKISQLPPSPKLAKVIYAAREKWAERLRDENKRDVDIVFQGARDLCEGRFSGIKHRMSLAGGAPYYMHPHDKDTETMCFGIVIKQCELDRFSTPEMLEEYGMRIYDNTAPAPPEPPVESQAPIVGAFSMRGPLSGLAPRGSNIRTTLRENQSSRWYVFPHSNMQQPRWNHNSAPFTEDYSHHNLTDSDWWRSDFEAKAALIESEERKRIPNRYKELTGEEPPAIGPEGDNASTENGYFAARKSLKLCNTFAHDYTTETRDKAEAAVIQSLFSEIAATEKEYFEAREAYNVACSTLKRTQEHSVLRFHHPTVNEMQRNVEYHIYHRIRSNFDSLRIDLNTMLGAMTKENATNGKITDPDTLAQVRKRLSVIVRATSASSRADNPTQRPDQRGLTAQVESEEDEPRLADLLQKKSVAKKKEKHVSFRLPEEEEEQEVQTPETFANFYYIPDAAVDRLKTIAKSPEKAQVGLVSRMLDLLSVRW